MILSVQTSLLPGAGLSEQFAVAQRCGFDAVEIPIGPTFDLGDRLIDIQRAIQATGVPVCAICSHDMHDPFVPDPAERARRFAALTAALRLCDEIGAAGIVSVPVRRPHSSAEDDAELMSQAIDAFGAWSKTLPAGRSALFLEPLNRYEATFLRRVGQAAHLAAGVGHPRVRALADLFHMNIEEADMRRPLLDAAGLLGHVHVADNNRLQPGAGCLDFVGPFSALKQIGYDGALSIECSALGGPLEREGVEAMLGESSRMLRDAWARA